MGYHPSYVWHKNEVLGHLSAKIHKFPKIDLMINFTVTTLKMHENQKIAGAKNTNRFDILSFV